MKFARPGILAVRAVNQYRRRDVFTFLGLRYYLANSASRSDAWIKNVATDLAALRSTPGYFHAYNFKEREPDGQHRHRSLHLPGANEALAEAALLAECAKHPEVFGNPSCLFSYKLTTGKSRNGVFEPYINGLKERLTAITKAASACPSGVVQYVDIKKFYPSISGAAALKAWKHCCSKASLAKPYAELGDKFIEDYIKIPRDNETGILTGPMFCHLLANLVLHDLDRDMSASLPAAYFRYVDDITLVGSDEAVNRALKILETRLAGMDLHLHPDGHEKRLRVPASEWLEAAGDYDEPNTPHKWSGLIGDLKRFLLIQRGNHSELRTRLRDSGFRLPVPDYGALVYEASWQERLAELLSFKWFRRKIQTVTVESLIQQAEWLREHYEAEMKNLLAELPDAKAFKRKRLVPRARYVAGRLTYLASNASLLKVCGQLQGIPELYLHGRVMEAVATGSVNGLLTLGANAVQAAAQLFTANDQSATLAEIPKEGAERQSLAVLIANGVRVESENLNDDSELMRIALHGCDRALMKSSDPFLRELACLHGLSSEARHADMFLTAFDQDDDLVMDTIDQLLDYPSP